MRAATCVRATRTSEGIGKAPDQQTCNRAEQPVASGRSSKGKLLGKLPNGQKRSPLEREGLRRV